MEKYTIEVYLVDEIGFETNITLYDISYSQAIELYALATVLNFQTKKIFIHLHEYFNSRVCIEELIILRTTNQLIEEIESNTCSARDLKNYAS